MLITQIIIAFPASTYMLRQILMVDRDDFNKFVVCPKCHKLYEYNQCLSTVNNREVAKLCSGFQQKRGKKVPCGAAILYKVQLMNGKKLLLPNKILLVLIA